MNNKITTDELKKRVDQFKSLSLPGQPMAMHMGTSYLVNDLWKEIASLTEKVERLEKALGQDAIVGFVNANGGREVHRSWRDNMLHQDRGLRIEYMEWDTLPISDQDLDRAISLDVLLDYSTWVIGHALLESER